jgi:hypothetical protein
MQNHKKNHRNGKKTLCFRIMACICMRISQ